MAKQKKSGKGTVPDSVKRNMRLTRLAQQLRALGKHSQRALLALTSAPLQPIEAEAGAPLMELKAALEAFDLKMAAWGDWANEVREQERGDLPLVR